MFAPLSPQTCKAYQADRVRIAEQSRVASQIKTRPVRRTLATVISSISQPRHEHQARAKEQQPLTTPAH